MSVYDPALRQSRRVAYALVPSDDGAPQLFIAEDAEVLTLTLVLRLVALRPDQAEPGQLTVIRDALRAEEWQQAIGAWMAATGQAVDVFDDEPVWAMAAPELDPDLIGLQLTQAPILAAPDGR